MKKWDREEFIKILNERLPLKEINNVNDDKRKSLEWTERKIRTYFSSKSALPSPLYEGKKVFYTEEHFEALKNLIELQDLGMSYKTSSSFYINRVEAKETSISNSLNSHNEINSSSKDSIFSLLENMKASNSVNISGSNNLRGLTKSSVLNEATSISNNKYVSIENINKYKIGNDIEISFKNNMNIEEIKKDIQEWLNNLK